MSYLLNNNYLLEELDQHVEGHQDAKKALIVMLSRIKTRFRQKYQSEMEDKYLLSPMKILLIGGSGTGKTHLIDSLQRIDYFPILKFDATHLNPSGSTGGLTPRDVFRKINEEAMLQAQITPSYFPTPQHALDSMVIFIDEIDKLGTSFDSSGNWNKHVQSNFLTLFDNKDEYAGLSFVFAGAFTSITQKKEDHVYRGIGFQHNNAPEKDLSLIDDKVVQAGMIPEIVGRLNYIAELDVFGEKEFRNVLINRVMPKKKLDLAAYHVFDAELTEEQITQICKDAVKSGQGVRYLQRAVDRIFLDAEFNCDNVDNLFLPPHEMCDEENLDEEEEYYE